MAVGLPGTARCTALIALVAAGAIASLLAATARAAPPNWTAPSDLTAPGRNAGNPLVAMDPAGNVTAIWERQSTTSAGTNLQVATRPAGGGAFPPGVDLAQRATEPRMAMAPNGDLYVVWKEFASPKYKIRMATKPAGGPFSAPFEVHEAPAGGVPTEIQIAVGAGGDVAVTWIDTDPSKPFVDIVCEYIFGQPIFCSNPPFVMATIREAGETGFEPAARLHPIRGIPPSGETAGDKEERYKAESHLSAYAPRPAVDPGGNLIVAYTYADESSNSARYSFRPASGSFLPSEPLSAAGENASIAGVGMDAAGNAIAAWTVEAGGPHALKAAIRPPGGEFQQLGAVSTFGTAAVEPSLDVAQDGTATMLWRTHDLFGDGVVQTSVRPPGGSFQPPTVISSGKDNPQFPRLARNSAGDEIVVWSGDSGLNKIVRASVRAAGGGYTPAVGISTLSPNAYRPVTALDASGNGAVVWVRSNGLHGIIQLAGYDAQPPQLGEVSIPSQATVGQTIDVFSAGSDLWGAPVISTSFGDDTQADGPAVSHVYSAPGTYTVRVTATDAVGRATETSAPIVVKARNSFSIGKLKRNRKKGTATLTVTVLEPGTVTSVAKGLRTASAGATAGGSVKLLLKASGKALKRLKRKGSLAARLTVAYQPVGGDPSSRPHRVTLKRDLSD